MKYLSILIVEDEGLIALNTRMLLEFLGHTVVGIAQNGTKALQMLEDLEPPDFALVDIKLKGDINGIETAILMKERFGIPFMFITGNTDPETIEEARMTYPFGILQKPFDEEELESAIETAISQMKMRPGPQA